ncbi:ribosomal protein S18-alanine N-acetyltransferase [Gemelliphila palaticanis]|uniref:[Ribosomal protein bS18]-alanine N-acetyltransferase n=1 Tax=Gemelliphila palaticanis TaxID=81950 RepID=A0ABX2T0N1_9BACL|nr:ribosomal protein S18-alanine N-acetyltransferase [Gemella palaticanis]MBF0715257.1 ribosomal protein S18-alanine N-acetyltransferase [Gemella palaticanis]NYS47187.1 ribosomal protein S18-alanine N-acetyltransferase [Gemella palaticanis]
MIKINRVGVEHLERLSEIDRNNFDDPWSLEMMKVELENENAEYYGIFNDDEILGFCGGWYVVDEYQINKIVIDKPHQNKKLGQMFLVYIMEMYRLKNARQATIEVRESNVRAIKAYTRSGFEVTGFRENYYQNNGETAYVMIREF